MDYEHNADDRYGSETMTVANFELRPETGAPLERELWLSAGAQIDYETPAQRKQRGLIVASRAVTSSVTAKEIVRGFVLDVTQVNEKVRWVRDFPVVRLQIPADLSPVFDTIELGFYAADEESDSFMINAGTVPAPLTALFGIDDNAKDLTITYPRQASNPASNQSFSIPVWLEQPRGTVVAGSRRNLSVSVLRFAPAAIHTSYEDLRSPGLLYIDATGDHVEATLNDWIQNPSSRPLRVGYGNSFDHRWSDVNATYQITVANGVFSFRADRVSPFPFSTTRTSNIAIGVQTTDAGDVSTKYINLRLRVEPPSS